MTETVIVVGGGAAGFFGAINIAEKHPDALVILLEKSRALLAKVRVSGGGRCNVTHACFDPMLLIKNYPRGGKELLGPFHKFQPRDTIDWFLRRGVQLKTEADGRMFPVSNTSETIIHTFLQAAAKSKVIVRPETNVESIKAISSGFELTTSNGEVLTCNKLLIASGSVAKVYSILETLGHSIVPPVPSLFTFTIKDAHPKNLRLHELSGLSVPSAHVTLENTRFEQTGPLLITHWGLSGPAILKLSAWAARYLHACNYNATLIVNWTGKSENEIREMLKSGNCPIPKNLWKFFCAKLELSADKIFSNKELNLMVELLVRSRWMIEGKSTNKDEFVTAGGVSLNEIDFRTMESKICPGLYFAGEVLDIDGVTGGFNFQSAWTTAWLASESIAYI